MSVQKILHNLRKDVENKNKILRNKYNQANEVYKNHKLGEKTKNYIKA